MAIGLVLGGGAPNLTLMTGALWALDHEGVEFKVITTTGAGMVVGLIYAAPQREVGEDWIKARRRALASTRDWGIDDAIYEGFPVNYKIFHKPGSAAEAFSRATIPMLWSIPRETRRQRLLGDALAFWAAAMSPSNLRPSSRGLCQPPPWIEYLVDFDSLTRNLAKGDKKFRISAYCIEDQILESFNKHEITPEHFKAALAMPFIYEPYRLRDPDGRWRTFIEGSALQTLDFNNENVMVENDIDTIIYFDLMGNRHLIGEPRHLIDAWGKSIVAPLTRIAEQDIELFKQRNKAHSIKLKKMQLEEQMAGRDSAEEARRRDESLDPNDWTPENDPAYYHPFAEETWVYRMNFGDHIPEELWPYVLDWSHSNMARLFDIGVETGKAFVKEHRDVLDRSMMLDPHRKVRKGLDPQHEHDARCTVEQEDA